MAVCRNVYRMRRARGWKMRELSERTSDAGKRVQLSTLSRMENARDGHRTVVVSVDDLSVLAAAFNVPMAEMLVPWEPKCTACMDAPPAGFACRSCGAEG